MGLTINQWGIKEILSMAYSSFYLFRVHLARMFSIDIEQMEGYKGSKEWKADQPFLILFKHSDNEGKIEYEDCITLYKDFRNYEMQFFKYATDDKEDTLFLTECYKNWMDILEAISKTSDAQGYLEFN